MISLKELSEMRELINEVHKVTYEQPTVEQLAYYSGVLTGNLFRLIREYEALRFPQTSPAPTWCDDMR